MATVTLNDLLPLEHRGWNALCSARGGTFYGELMTDDAVMVLVNGMVLARDTVASPPSPTRLLRLPHFQSTWGGYFSQTPTPSRLKAKVGKGQEVKARPVSVS
ncbi:hypothetical protein F7P69_12430 [Cellulosimicrobium funkei]|nr:hypothetical protein [Cellulosimicrobium funkei]